ncbi:MAG: acyl-CoA N-acyltransferase [Monoraphidium minutum]|nr:MAG: acyl-CoA N-acyltransferase [Monoraphidium minutum]
MKVLDSLPQWQPHHQDHLVLHAARLADAPRLLAVRHAHRARAAAPKCVVHVAHAAADAAPAAEPAAYVLVEESQHAGPRFSIIPVDEPEAAGRAASRAALEAVCDLSLDTLRFFGMPRLADEAAAELLPARGYARVSHNPCAQFVLRRPLAPAAVERWRRDVERLEGEGFALSQLREGDAELVDSLWPYRSATSLDFIKTAIIRGGLATSCVREGGPAGAVVAWVVEYEDGSLGMLTTLRSHRRRGLARAALVGLVQRLVEGEGRLAAHPLFCYVVAGNAPSLALLASLGFEETGVFAWQAWRRARGSGRGA